MEILTCRACADFLADYLSGDIEPTVRAAFEVHLARCGDCRIYLEQYAAVIGAGRNACARETEQAAAAIPEELVAAIVAALRTGP